MSEIEEINNWLESVLGMKSVEWEVNSGSLEFLKNLRARNIKNEKLLQVTLDETDRLTKEYDGELKRLNKILTELGIDHNNLPGSAGPYLQVLAESCAVLDEDNIGRGVQVSLSRAVQQQADAAPLIAVTKDKIEAIKVDNLKLYSQLERLEEAVKFADKEGGKDLELSKSYSVKLDFMTAKEKQYKTSLEKDEMAHIKLTGGDKNLTHHNIKQLEEKIIGLEKDVEEAKRTISGYLNLPPSMEMAKLEISKAEAELEELTSQLNINIASVHL